MLGATLRRVDFYRKVPNDLTEPTTAGAIISILCGSFMLFLLCSELLSFIQVEKSSEMYVQQDEGGKLRLNFDMTFPQLPCFVFSLDVLDIMGRHEVGVSQGINRTRLNAQGEPIGVLTSDQVSDAEAQSMREEGCNAQGFVYVNKVPGNFHISSHGQQHMVQRYLGGVTNVHHIIHAFYAGEVPLDPAQFPGSLRPLDGLERTDTDPLTTYEYWVDVIPTVYSNTRLKETKAYQLTAHTHQFKTAAQYPPAVYFRYQLSPITVKFNSRSKSFAHFLTYVCAIIGGVFTVAGIMNSILHNSIVAFQKNVLGKTS
eukprot:TRINITY_DN67673_c9_g1_i1.p1 TRINITY_DN67673_c9_g1~~TRINITY_DN67673_c9_g1_i1.p1  ORF type:complete len:314 (-),score=24.34 TRINITY_DN67673_c9_g1_i1:418-1359(-)